MHTGLACRHLLRPMQSRALWHFMQAQSTLHASSHPQPSTSGHPGKWLLGVLACVGAASMMLQAAPAAADTLVSMQKVAGGSAQSELSCGALLRPHTLNMFTAVSVMVTETCCLRLKSRAKNHVDIPSESCDSLGTLFKCLRVGTFAVVLIQNASAQARKPNWF
jgi:hypothetical protein